MSPPNTLHLVVPALLAPMPASAGTGDRLELPNLQRLLSRADVGKVAGHDYSETLFSLFEIATEAVLDLPEGAVCLLGEGGEAAHHCWMRADPVHLRADRDRLLLFNASGLEISLQEAQALARGINLHFADAGLRLVTPHPQRWYLQLPRCPEIRTHSLDEVSGRDVEQFMPSGTESRRWRQLSNEMQMLLFHDPVNQRRESEGRPSINGIWLSGVGRLPAPGGRRYAQVWGEEPLVLGLARLHGIESRELPADPTAAWPQKVSSLMVWDRLLPAVWNADAQAWGDGLLQLEAVIGSLLDTLRQDPSAGLLLYPCNGSVYRLSGRNLRRFWRRSRALNDFLVR